MIFEENEIKNAMPWLDDPRLVPCGDIVCSQCQATIYVNNRQFNCILCNKTHFMPDEGLPVVKLALNLLSLQPSEVYRSPSVEELKERLDTMRQKINALSFGINNGLDKIKDLFIKLRNEVQLATEQAIGQINELNCELIADINQFEKDTSKAYQPAEVNKEEAIKLVEELESFQSKWTRYLNQAKISHYEILKANHKAKQLIMKADREEIKLNSVVFSEGLLKFIKNPNKLDKPLVGYLEIYGGLSVNIESSILSSNEMNQLFSL